MPVKRSWNDYCTVVMRKHSPSGCGYYEGPGVSFFWKLVLIGLGGAILYVIVGTIVKLIHGYKGIQALPHYEWWVSFFKKIKSKSRYQAL